MSKAFSATEWRAELEQLQTETVKNGEGLTAEEMSQAVGKCLSWVRLRLHAAKRQGRLVVNTAIRENLAGRPQARIVYVILPPKNVRARKLPK